MHPAHYRFNVDALYKLTVTLTDVHNSHWPFVEPIRTQKSAIVSNVVASHMVVWSRPLSVSVTANCRTRQVHDRLATKPKTRREIIVAVHINVGKTETCHGSTPKCAARLGMCCNSDDSPTKRQNAVKRNSWNGTDRSKETSNRSANRCLNQPSRLATRDLERWLLLFSMALLFSVASLFSCCSFDEAFGSVLSIVNIISSLSPAMLANFVLPVVSPWHWMPGAGRKRQANTHSWQNIPAMISRVPRTPYMSRSMVVSGPNVRPPTEKPAVPILTAKARCRLKYWGSRTNAEIIIMPAPLPDNTASCTTEKLPGKLNHTDRSTRRPTVKLA